MSEMSLRYKGLAKHAQQHLHHTRKSREPLTTRRWSNARKREEKEIQQPPKSEREGKTEGLRTPPNLETSDRRSRKDEGTVQPVRGGSGWKYFEGGVVETRMGVKTQENDKTISRNKGLAETSNKRAAATDSVGSKGQQQKTQEGSYERMAPPTEPANSDAANRRKMFI